MDVDELQQLLLEARETIGAAQEGAMETFRQLKRLGRERNQIEDDFAKAEASRTLIKRLQRGIDDQNSRALFAEKLVLQMASAVQHGLSLNPPAEPEDSQSAAEIMDLRDQLQETQNLVTDLRNQQFTLIQQYEDDLDALNAQLATRAAAEISPQTDDTSELSAKFISLSQKLVETERLLAEATATPSSSTQVLQDEITTHRTSIALLERRLATVEAERDDAVERGKTRVMHERHNVAKLMAELNEVKLKLRDVSSTPSDRSMVQVRMDLSDSPIGLRHRERSDSSSLGWRPAKAARASETSQRRRRPVGLVDTIFAVPIVRRVFVIYTIFIHCLLIYFLMKLLVVEKEMPYDDDIA